MKVHELTELQWIRTAAASGEARRIRLAAGLSQAEVAVPVDVVPSTIALWEAAKRRPRGAAALRYAAVIRSLSRAMATQQGAGHGPAA